jgi:glycosyltransferase 2 family protein
MPLPRLPSLPSWLITAIKVAVSVGLLALLVSQVDWAAIHDSLSLAMLPALIAGTLLLMLPSLAIAIRWYVLLEAMEHPVPFRWSLRQAFIGVFFNQCLPTSIGGDGYRIIVAKQRGLDWRDATASVLVERYVGLICLLLVAACGMVPLALSLTSEAITGLLILVVAGAIFGAFGVAAVAEIATFRKLPGIVTKLLNWWIVGRILGLIRRVVRSQRILGILLVTSVIGHLVNSIAVWMLGQSIGVEVGIGTYLAVLSLAVLATLIPLSIAGWGIRDGVIVGLLGAVGVAHEQALVLSIGFGVMLLLASLPGGILFWFRSQQIGKDAPASADPTIEAGNGSD